MIDLVAGTLASSTYAQLRREILDGDQVPGSRLHIRQLCERFGIGASPMREALNRLSAEGLVQQLDQRGFRVAPLDLEDLSDLTRMRCWLNEIALRAAISAGDAAWEEGLVVAHYRLMRAPKETSPVDGRRSAAWERAHRDFHAALIAACGSRRLMEQCAALFDAADRYRHVSRIASSDRRDDADEHTQIMEAALRRNGDGAVALLTRHMANTEELVRAALVGAASRE
ncbi:GntR family transcriptional regulator [Aliidongia dinghuensis]|uniref:GntR family transcriptional regulator n=1 Tax=Aliidongia dinghuensis TaxID=1867774 RepID=A0A8J3E620_9PROT|nr:GntR family transcriptional regulator [Aliidongia dinghuensis]GGF40494.1 GntR family transcriptional regulator [Aliidongia dinghuensis]